MVKITIENLGKKELEVNDLSLTVLRHLHSHFVDWLHACGAKGRCTTCKMIIVSGMENLSPPTVAEKKYQELGALTENERLACQCRVSGNVLIRVPEESKLQHIQYS